MSTCFFNSCKEWGGGEKWHLEMANSLQKHGMEVILVATSASELSSKARQAEIPFEQVHVSNLSFLNPFKIYKISRMFRRQRVQTVILNLPSDLKAAGIAARIAGVKKIIYRRGSAIPIRNTFLNRFLFRRVVTEVIANSIETKETILAHNESLIPSDRVTVIYNGIDLEEFDRRPVQEIYSRRPGEFVLGHAGRLSRQKNQKFLIEVIRDLKAKGLDCTLLIAGKGHLENDLKSYAKSLEIEENVVFLGFQEDIKSFMSNVDVFLLSSLWEGFGYVLVEAMAAEKPVVAFGNSSTPEIVLDEVTGRLISPGDRPDFVDALWKLAGNADRRHLLGQAGRVRVEKKFSIQHSIDQLVKMLSVSGLS